MLRSLEETRRDESSILYSIVCEVVDKGTEKNRVRKIKYEIFFEKQILFYLKATWNLSNSERL